MAQSTPNRLNSISDLHRFNRIAPPKHPLISLIDYGTIRPLAVDNELNWVQQFYTISIKRGVVGKYRYGQSSYDFDGGLMTFFSPEQLISVKLIEEDAISRPSGLILAIHPDFLHGSTLAVEIKKYSFLNYSVREALFLSDSEEKVMRRLLENIESEYESQADGLSKKIVLSQLELLLDYSERFYQRQFDTRQTSSHQVLHRLEEILEDYFQDEDLLRQGLITVQYVAEQLNLTPDYLSGLLKNLTGQTTQQHIHQKLIEQSKVKLSTTDLTVSEIAFGLGFVHSQSFSKFFKSKTEQTPKQFRESFR